MLAKTTIPITRAAILMLRPQNVSEQSRTGGNSRLCAEKEENYERTDLWG